MRPRNAFGPEVGQGEKCRREDELSLKVRGLFWVLLLHWAFVHGHVTKSYESASERAIRSCDRVSPDDHVDV